MLLIIIALFVFGAALGSFACCQAWRIKNEDKSPRSHCENCDYKLKWYDSIPVISWLTLRGKCRKCGKPIGAAEILTEIGLGVVFALTYVLWPFTLDYASPLSIAQFIVFLALLVGFCVLFVYDWRWGELPIKPLIFCIICAIIWISLQHGASIALGSFSPNTIIDLLGALLVLPGLYYFMYKMSDERWVGGGDWILCIPLALILGNFWMAFFCLFISNLLGCVFAIPVLVSKKKKRGAKIHFGPFLILGFLAVFFAQNLISGFLFFW
ncbi:MAG: prepilin peptidase [Candidatus Saccharimonadales bacterium]